MEDDDAGAATGDDTDEDENDEDERNGFDAPVAGEEGTETEAVLPARAGAYCSERQTHANAETQQDLPSQQSYKTTAGQAVNRTAHTAESYRNMLSAHTSFMSTSV